MFSRSYPNIFHNQSNGDFRDISIVLHVCFSLVNINYLGLCLIIITHYHYSFYKRPIFHVHHRISTNNRHYAFAFSVHFEHH